MTPPTEYRTPSLWNNKEIRIAVVGAGAIGGVTAACLKMAGWTRK